MRKAGRAFPKAQLRKCTKISQGVVLALLSMLAAPNADAVEFDTGNSDVKMVWDNTVKYSVAWRVKNLDPQVAGSSYNPNLDDGDRNFRKGLISNRLDLLTEFDLKFKRDLGLRVSGAAWYDSVYHRSNDNDSPATFNPVSVSNNEFTKATEKLHGRKAEFLDAFVFGKFTPDDMSLNVRVGRFAQIYGESVFFGANGIAAAQASPDIIKLLSVPSSQIKEILRPVGQVSGQLQISPHLSVGAYYQYEWQKARLPGAGSYFSFSDFVDDGGERVIVGVPLIPGGGPTAFFRGQDIQARDSGQGGAQVRYKVADWEFGLYAARFHDKFPQFYFRPGAANLATGQVGDYVFVYGQDLKTYGASLSTVVGETNVAAEVSVRRNATLTATSNVVVDPTFLTGLPAGDGRGNPLYPVGNSFHANLSAITVLPANALWQGALFVGELAFNRRTSITKNAAQLDPNTTRDAWALRFIFQPEYFQVLPGLDLQVPIGLGYGISGRTSAVGAAFPAEHGGDVSIGLKGDYRKTWQGSLTYTHFYGRAGGVVNPLTQLSFDQFHRDRDFISLSIQRTF